MAAEWRRCRWLRGSGAARLLRHWRRSSSCSSRQARRAAPHFSTKIKHSSNARWQRERGGGTDLDGTVAGRQANGLWQAQRRADGGPKRRHTAHGNHFDAHAAHCDRRGRHGGQTTGGGCCGSSYKGASGGRQERRKGSSTGRRRHLSDAAGAEERAAERARRGQMAQCWQQCDRGHGARVTRAAERSGGHTVGTRLWACSCFAGLGARVAEQSRSDGMASLDQARGPRACLFTAALLAPAVPAPRLQRVASLRHRVPDWALRVQLPRAGL